MDIKRIIKDTVREVLPLIMAERAKQRPVSAYKMTEARLYAYPVLKDNVTNIYPADIADLEREKVTGRSKDICMWTTHGGEPISPEERQAARILAVKIKLDRDRASLAELDRALATIKDEYYYKALEAFYFGGVDVDAIADNMGDTPAAVRRGKSALVRTLALRLYGAEALDEL